MIRSAAVWAAVCVTSLGVGGNAWARDRHAPAVEVPQGAAAYAVLAPATAATGDYLMVVGDTLIIRVFDEPELSSDAVVIDGGGKIQEPLIGEVAAAGRSPAQVAAEITARLRARYLVNPQVTVSIKTAAVRSISVEGQVTRPGVYEIDRNATLLTAMAKAESPTNVARLGDVVVFRTIGGNRAAARFDLADIRAARAADPPILGGDVIVVGYSKTKSAFRNLLQAAPLFNLFYLLR